MEILKIIVFALSCGVVAFAVLYSEKIIIKYNEKKKYKDYIIVTTNNRWVGITFHSDLKDLRDYIDECKEMVEMNEDLIVYEIKDKFELPKHTIDEIEHIKTGNNEKI